MWFRRKQKLRMVEYKCSPALEGKVCTAFGAVVMLAILADFIIDGMGHWAVVVLSLSLSIGVLAYGLYFWKFRLKPITRSVTLGGRADRIYRKGKWMFVLYCVLAGAVSYPLIVAVMTFVFEGEWSWTGYWTELTDDNLGILMFIGVFPVKNFLEYYQYYRIPEGQRQETLSIEY